jgi:hypothetical protein
MREKPTGITPAALEAIANGDAFNAALAMTPGGIEAQEAVGQKMLVVSDTLPTKGLLFDQIRAGGPANIYADFIQKLGFNIGDAVDELFTVVHLPPGWKKQPTEHSMWSDLLDERGRIRASIFYKAAFYDRRAHIHWNSPVTTALFYTEDGKNQYDHPRGIGGSLVGVVKLDGKEIWRSDVVVVESGASDILQKQRWLKEEGIGQLCAKQADILFPDRQNPFAYWS